MFKLQGAGPYPSGPNPTPTAAAPVRRSVRMAGAANDVSGAPADDFTQIRGPATKTVHSIDYRVSISTLFFGGWYLVLLAGPERRNRKRLEREGQTSLSRRFVAISAALIAVLFFAGIGLATFTYLLKCALKINIFSAPSFMHPVYELLW